MKASKTITLVLVTTMLTACADNYSRPGSGVMQGGTMNKEDVGTAAGAIAGGVAGYQFGGGAGQAVATVGGALLGGMLGKSVGRSMDNADRVAYDDASYYALENGRSQSWNNPHNGNRGTFVPKRGYHDNYGRYCREYTQTIYVDGRRHNGYGTACRQDDGTWAIVD